MNSRRALVIEQGLEVQEFLFSVPGHAWQVTLARSVRSALAALTRGQGFELVAIDEGPESGPGLWQSVKDLADASGRAPVLLFTERTSVEKQLRARECGLAALVVKPAAAARSFTVTDASDAAASPDPVPDSR